jgi:hypothetical protein
VDITPDQAEKLPDGVVVVRSVSGVANGDRAFRVTMGTDAEPRVTVVSEVRALHELIDQWVDSLGS